LAAVFLSYSRLDGTIADEIAKVLSELGVSYFRDVNDVRPGKDFESEVRAALLECIVVLVVISRASLQSAWVPFELGYGIARGKDLLPFVTEPGLDLPIYLAKLQHLTSLDGLREHFKSRKFHADAHSTFHLLQESILLTADKPPNALLGRWSGTGHQQRGPDNQPTDWSLTLHMRSNGDQIEGEMLMQGAVHGEPYQVDFDVKGGMVGGRFAWLNYMAKDPSRLHFGTVVLDLSRDALIGEYTGYGALTKGVVSGYVRLSKDT
jgi:hypothetical protein